MDSATDRDHASVGLIVVPEIVFFGFPSHDIKKQSPQFIVRATGSEWAEKVKLQVAPQAGAQLPVAGETEFVTGLTEMEIRHRTDESDQLIRAGDLKITGGAVGLKIGARQQRAVRLLDDLTSRAAAQEVGIAQHIGGADWHELDEPQKRTFFPGKTNEGGELIFCLVFHQDAIELQRGEAR